MDENKIIVELTRIELEVAIAAIGSANPIDKTLEVIQFQLYHKLLFKLKEISR